MVRQGTHLTERAGESTYALTCPVVFVGFMGAGKTSVARRIARLTGLVSIDADTSFAHDMGMDAGTFIRTYGEDAFRTEETALLRELLDREPSFISCGGGVVERTENRKLLDRYFVVFLDITADEARQRISNVESRPLFGDMDHARALNDRRRPLYEEIADVRVEVAGKSVGVLADEVMHLLEERGVLCQQPK